MSPSECSERAPTTSIAGSRHFCALSEAATAPGGRRLLIRPLPVVCLPGAETSKGDETMARKSKRADTHSVDLLSGGTVQVSFSGSVFDLFGEDREFVNYLADVVHEYERTHPAVPTTKRQKKRAKATAPPDEPRATALPEEPTDEF